MTNFLLSRSIIMTVFDLAMIAIQRNRKRLMIGLVQLLSNTSGYLRNYLIEGPNSLILRKSTTQDKAR